MGFAPFMWIVWVVLVVITAALYLYRMSLTRNEEDQIFLDDSFDHEKAAQEGIIAKVNKVEPYIRVFSWLLAIMSVFVVVYYAVYIFNVLVR
jgi:hypothetical protein